MDFAENRVRGLPYRLSVHLHYDHLIPYADLVFAELAAARFGDPNSSRLADVAKVFGLHLCCLVKMSYRPSSSFLHRQEPFHSRPGGPNLADLNIQLSMGAYRS